ncbi:MAG: hypothetical protein K8J31_11185 [Anaerolineae bacterium]|nr:hypothetical protein [Anaerolineae bacterium]
MADFTALEAIATEVIETFEIKGPPVPIESMLQRPKEGMWEELDITKLSGGFLSVKDPYSPRMSLTRLLARHIIGSDWGRARRMNEIVKTEEAIHAFARMLIMPSNMIRALSLSARNPTAMSLHFEVPEDDARQRLVELSGQL